MRCIASKHYVDIYFTDGDKCQCDMTQPESRRVTKSKSVNDSRLTETERCSVCSTRFSDFVLCASFQQDVRHPSARDSRVARAPAWPLPHRAPQPQGCAGHAHWP